MRFMPWLEPVTEGVRIHVRVVPRASRNGAQGLLGDAIKIRLQAPPVEGKANLALIAFLADALHIPSRNVELLHGETGRNKTVLIRNTTESEVRKALGI